MGNRGFYFYNDTEERSVNTFYGKPGDPNKGYIRHYRNWIELQFIYGASEGLDRFQANKELKLCEDKLERISKKPGFVLRECLPEIQKIKRDWQKSDVPDRWSR